LTDTGGECGIPKDRRARHVGRNLFEQLQPIGCKKSPALAMAEFAVAVVLHVLGL
jgi:hypothetical protein